MLIKTNPVAFEGAFLKIADVDPKESQNSSLANFLRVMSTLLHRLSKNAVVRVFMKARALLRHISLFLRCIQFSLHATTLAPILCSAWALDRGTISIEMESITSAMSPAV